jgi:hypothetical protein
MALHRLRVHDLAAVRPTKRRINPPHVRGDVRVAWRESYKDVRLLCVEARRKWPFGQDETGHAPLLDHPVLDVPVDQVLEVFGQEGHAFLLAVGLDAGIDLLGRCEEAKSVVHVDGLTVLYEVIRFTRADLVQVTVLADWRRGELSKLCARQVCSGDLEMHPVDLDVEGVVLWRALAVLLALLLAGFSHDDLLGRYQDTTVKRYLTTELPRR